MNIYTSDEVLLEMLMNNLEMLTDYMDTDSIVSKQDELMMYINSAKEFIEREGITLQDTIGDAMLITMYSAWLYERRKAVSTGDYVTNAMPRMLRWNLNNRLFQEKVRE